MFIKVINWCNHSILARDNEPIFYLERDNWDDNYYKTRYHLHLSGKYTDNDEAQWIGEVKILRKGQRKEDVALLEPGKLDYLGYRFCSVGQSLDYYEKISRLEEPLRYKILSALRDIIIYPDVRKEFEHEEGMDVSLLHYLDQDDDIFALAPAIISGDFKNLPAPNIAFRFQFPTLKESLKFDFESPEYGYHESTDETLRVSVISPANETSRNEVLTRLAQITYAAREERDLVPEIGTIFPEGTAFTKIICLSYDNMPTFRIPGIYVQAMEQVAREVNQGIGRFIYCGVHDLGKELEEALTHYTIDTDGRVWQHENLSVESPSACLKSTESLASEFVRSIALIEQNLDKQDTLDNVFHLLHDVKDLQFITQITFQNLREEELYTFFMNLSPDQQFLFHALTTSVQGISPRSLVLFHEPEAGVAPELLPVMMKSMKYILDRENAFMIVSTLSTDIFSEDAFKKVSVLNTKELESKPPAHANEGVVISHILGLPNDIFPKS